MTECRRIFVDTAPFIYLLEHNNQYYDRLEKAFGQWHSGHVTVITSTITIAEYCTYPFRVGRMDLIEKFDQFLIAFGVRVIGVDTEVAKKAAQIRGQYAGFKAMDAIQLSVANLYNCDCFLTNDKQLCQYNDLNCVLVDKME